jgi:hypothetical protein
MSSILQPPDGDSAGKPGDANLSGAEFATVMLRALIDMAARSQRRQADLLAALRGADLPADPQQVRAALRLLQNQGCVSDLVPLSDGGLLLTVTRQAVQQGDALPQWLPLDDLEASPHGTRSATATGDGAMPVV